jgi:hypothetical protein
VERAEGVEGADGHPGPRVPSTEPTRRLTSSWGSAS